MSVVTWVILSVVAADSSAEMMGLRVQERGSGVRVVAVVGEVDTETAPELAAVLSTQLAEARLVVVDLDGVEFFGSAGLQALFEAHELAVRRGRGLRLVCHSRMVNRVMDTSGLRQRFIFVDNVSAAVENLP